MTNNKWFTILFIMGILNCTLSNAQIEKAKIKDTSKISSLFIQHEQHKYTIDLNKNEYAFFKVMQLGIDLMITTYDSKGNKKEVFDSPNGTNGPEYITLLSDNSGKYSFIVEPLEKINSTGAYTLELIKTEAKTNDLTKQVDQLFIPWYSQEGPGAVVSICKDGKVLYSKGYGSANIEYNIPNSPSTVFHIASVSKQVTAFSILLLAKEGKLKLDEDIRKYVKEVPDFGKKITIEQLIFHTSGLRDQWSLLLMAGWRFDDVITQEQIMKMISRQKELNFNPGEEYSYCNTGYTLLAEIVARVSGKSFVNFTKERIFQPLKMNNTQFCDDHEKIIKNRAYSYYTDSSGYKKSVLNYANVGATSMQTTAEDLNLWANNFENPIVGDKAIIQQMNTRGRLNNGDTLNYAFGQMVHTYKSLPIIEHGGTDAGYRAFLGRFPEQKFNVIVLSNDAGIDAQAMAMKITDIYLKDNFKNEKENEKKEESRSSSGLSQGMLPVTRSYDQYVGKYYSEELETTYEFKIIKGKLTAVHQRHPNISLSCLDNDHLAGDEWFLMGIEIVRDEKKNIIGMRVSNGRVRKLLFKKM